MVDVIVARIGVPASQLPFVQILALGARQLRFRGCIPAFRMGIGRGLASTPHNGFAVLPYHSTSSRCVPVVAASP